jgi:uncharacterized membrane protein YcaP (DUF421 family)
VDDLIGVALRVSVMYLYVLAALRLNGKRDIGQLSIPDAVAAFIVGDMFDDIFWAEISLAKGVVGITTVVLLHLLVMYAACRSKTLDRLFVSGPTLLVRGGHLVREGLAREHLRPEEVLSELRGRGIDDPAEVKEAYREPNGHLSAVLLEERRPAQRRDRSRLEALLP